MKRIQPMTYAYLQETESKATVATAAQLRGISTEFPGIVDALLRLPCFFQLAPDETGFGPWAQLILTSAGHTAAAAFSLWNRAYYLESMFLVRHLVEVLAQIRYYHSRRGAFLRHQRAAHERAGGKLSEGAQAKHIGFAEIFGKVAPRFHKTHYGALLSGMTHGGFAALIMRFEFKGPNEPVKPTFGCIFSEDRAGIVASYLTLTMYGLIRAGLDLDPKVLGVADQETQAVVKRDVAWLGRSLQADWDEFPKKRDLLSACINMIGWRPVQLA